MTHSDEDTSVQPTPASMPPIHYWQYFVALEEDLARTTRFVEISDANMGAYSIEFARIILSACAEIDALFKLLMEEHQLTPERSNIVGYSKAAHARFPKLHALPIRLPRYERELLPWACLAVGKTPTWWEAHAEIKHTRGVSFPKATLENALSAVAGLFVLVCYLCEKELRANRALPWPQLLSLDERLSRRASGDLRPGHVLPDFA